MATERTRLAAYGDFEAGGTGMTSKTKTVTCTLLGCLCIIGILLAVILIPASIRSVEHEEYAIRYDGLSNKIHKDVYTEGKYLLTPQTIMFKFSNLVKKMEIDLPCLTANGVQVKLDVDVQYQMPMKQVYFAFKNYGSEERLVRYLNVVATDSVRDSCGKYTAKEYYEGRLSVQNTLEDALIVDVRKANVYFNITSAVLASYSFPLQLADSIRDKRAAENDIVIADNEREGALVEANTALLTAQIDAETVAIGAQAEVDSILVEASLQSEAIQSIWENRHSVYNNIMNEMNVSVDRFVFQYLTSVILLNADDPITSL